MKKCDYLISNFNGTLLIRHGYQTNNVYDKLLSSNTVIINPTNKILFRLQIMQYCLDYS